MKLGNNRGALLILTFIFLVTLAGIVVAYLALVSRTTKIVGFDVTDAQALYLAEAGIQRAIWYLENTAPDGTTDGSWRTTDYPASPGPNPTDPQEESFGAGSFILWVKTSGLNIQITGRGVVGSITRTVRQEITLSRTWPAAFSYAVFGNTNANELQLKDDVAISGDFYYDGDVEVQEDASVADGLVYADSVTGEGTYTAAPSLPDPVPTYPSIDSTYDDQVTTAESEASGNWTLSGSSSYNLNGGTVYYEKVTIKDNATITGSGTIVATKEVEIKNSANIGQNITIISKKTIDIKNDAIVQSGAVVYSQQDITVKDDTNVTGSLLAPKSNKKVSMQDNARLTGIIYADKVELKGSAVINGSVVADEYQGNKIQDNVAITYDSSYLPASLPPGLGTGNDAAAVDNTWEEL